MSALRKEFDRLLDRARESTPLPGRRPFDLPGGLNCHWKASRALSPTNPYQWLVTVQPGAVNDIVASVPYLPTGDPRGFTLTPGYPGLPRLLAIYGSYDKILVVDRLLTESPAPYLIAQSPALDGASPGDFQKVPDSQRPPYFATAAMWKFDLWQASLYLGASSIGRSVSDTFILPSSLGRYRLGIAPAVPTVPPQDSTIAGYKELHRLYLTRDPTNVARDALYLQQRLFWSLWTANAAYVAGAASNKLGALENLYVNSAVINFLQQAQSSLAHVDMWSA